MSVLIKAKELKRQARQTMSTKKEPTSSTDDSTELTNHTELPDTVEPDEAALTLAKKARKAEYIELAKQGLWKNNPGLVQLLGLCPLLAVTASVTNALGLGLATLFVLVCSNATVSAVRHWVPKEIRIPSFDYRCFCYLRTIVNECLYL
jgi:electron transport complex protein RnfE